MKFLALIPTIGRILCLILGVWLIAKATIDIRRTQSIVKATAGAVMLAVFVLAQPTGPVVEDQPVRPIRRFRYASKMRPSDLES